MTMGAKPQGLDGRAITLFNGSNWSQWVDRQGKPSAWEIKPEGAILVKGGDALTTREFGDAQIHLEFRCPNIEGATGQARGNSGVYIQGRYEVQVLDSYGGPPKENGCGGIYGQATPLVNACAPPEFWQTYDIVFRAPRFDDKGAVTEKPRLTVFQNGVVIHNNIELSGPTGGAIAENMVPTGPLLLQDHGDPVMYRNIWIRPL
jgi:hypothetical protein